MGGIVCPSVDKIDDVAEWVKVRYGYILEELEKKMLEQQSASNDNVVQLNIRQTSLVCGGKRSNKHELDPKEHEDRLWRRWIKRDKHGQLPHRWQQGASGRHGRAKLRTTMI